MSDKALSLGELSFGWCIVANEMIDDAKRRRKRCIMLKVDFEKAYDLMSWDFLFYMLKRLGIVKGGLCLLRGAWSLLQFLCLLILIL